MKTHVNLRTKNLAASVSFYRTLLQAEPEKHFGDYALFITEDPGLELALDSDPSAEVTDPAHYGIVVGTPDDVEAAILRLQAANLRTTVERDETCCYALQTKVWVADPDGRRWEIYTVLKDTQTRGDRETSCCRSDVGAESCCSV
ncbi:MAG TPA: ArsI/CadI family heavy metal resistance metalloenzyme [Candidatus Cybelea sp.]|jgi:catechol 2,3-dioxygenase-like lactoylglutathione lyase family enzyme